MSIFLKKTVFGVGMILFALGAAIQVRASSDSAVIGGAFVADGMGARPLGMGGAFVAVADDANANYSNPAGMGFFKSNNHYATFTHSNLYGIRGLNRDFVSYAQGNSGSFGAMGFSWNRLSVDLDGASYSEDVLAYSGAAVLTKGDEYPRYALGWNLKYLRVDSSFSDLADGSQVGNGRASGYGIDLGLMAKIRKSLSIGIMVQDVYSALNWDTGTLEIVPVTGKAGFAYAFTDRTTFSVEGRAAQSSNGFELSSWHVGGEHWFFDGDKDMWGAIRNIGLRLGGQKTLVNNDSGILSTGASAVADRWQIDYSYQFPITGSQFLGSTHRFGISLVF